jgi:hypothetical protein
MRLDSAGSRRINVFMESQNNNYIVLIHIKNN